MTRLISKRFFATALLAIPFLAPSRFVAAEHHPVFSKPAPESAGDIEAVEKHVREILDKVRPATVALNLGRSFGSGVIVTDDGLIMTAAHVVEIPGRNVRIIFPDGRIVAGKTLGYDAKVDAGMVRITDKGPWPFVPIAPKDTPPKPGEWCVATGHPSGFMSDRKPPLRLGRIISYDKTVIRTDCVITGGDSGGPLVNMNGEVIGIHSRIAQSTTMNLHVPAIAYHNHWDELKSGEVVGESPSVKFLEKFDTNSDGKIVRSEIPQGTYRKVFDRILKKYDLDVNKSHVIDDLRKKMGFSTAPPRFVPKFTSFNSGVELAREKFAGGALVREAFAPYVKPVNQSVARVLHKNKMVSIATVVAKDMLVTKASQLPPGKTVLCQQHGSVPFKAAVAYVDVSSDLALLKIDKENLRPVTFSDMPLNPGSWIASAGPNGPLSVGMVSVAERQIPRTPGVLGVQIAEGPDGPIAELVHDNSGAKVAGIKNGDVIQGINEQVIETFSHLKDAIQKHRVGEVVNVKVKRGKKQLEFDVKLKMILDISNASRRAEMGGRLSDRRDDFTVAVQHDTVLKPEQCGGPIVDFQGNVVGLNIARSDRIASLSLPSHKVIAWVSGARDAIAKKKKPAADKSKSKK